MAFELFYLTQIGARYAAKTATGAKLELTKAQFGSGIVSVGLSGRTSLLEPLGEMAIVKTRSEGDTAVVTVQFSNKVGDTLLDPFYLAEMGLFGRIADDPDCPEALIAYGNAKTLNQADHIPATLTEFLINWQLVVSNADNVTITQDESLIYVTKKELEERLESFKTEELDALLSVFTADQIDKAFTSVFTYLGDNPPTPEENTAEMESNDVENALESEYTGASSTDSNAMNALEIEQALSVTWNGESSDDPTALNAEEISEAINRAETT